MNHRQPEQLNNAQFPAESEPEYTLEEIMAEFGAPQEAEQTPEPVSEFRPVPDRRPPRPERSAPASKPKAKKRPVQIVERPKPEPEPPTLRSVSVSP